MELKQKVMDRVETDHVHVKENEHIEDHEETDLDLENIEKEVEKGIVIETVIEKGIKKDIMRTITAEKDLEAENEIVIGNIENAVVKIVLRGKMYGPD